MDIEINKDYTMHKKLQNGISLSEEEIDILKNYDIDYLGVNSIKELIYILEDIYNETGDEIINNLLDNLSERDYYENFNK